MPLGGTPIACIKIRQTILHMQFNSSIAYLQVAHKSQWPEAGTMK